MARVEIRDVGKYGVILDTPAHELPPEAWTHLRNVRAADDCIEPMYGEVRVFTELEGAPNDPVTHPINLFYCPTVQGIPLWVYGGTDKIGVYGASYGHVDITPTGATLTGPENFLWSGTWLNGVFFMNIRTAEAMVWDNLDPGTPVLMKKMSDVAGSEFQDTWRFTALRAYKEILIGIGFTDDGADYPTTIKWSGPATAGTVPTSWNEANLNNIAGERPLSATPGRAIDGMQLGNNFIICKEDATIVATFAQGTSPLVFRYIDNNSGVLTVNCMVEYSPGKMLILNQNLDVMMTDGTQVVSILSKRVRKYLAGRINPEKGWQCYVVHSFEKREVWICYPILGSTALSTWILASGFWEDAGLWDDEALWEDEETGVPTGSSDVGCQEALIWNYEDNTFVFYDLGRLNHIGFGKITETGTTLPIDEVDTIINEAKAIIDGGGAISSSQLIGCSTGRNAFFALDRGITIDSIPLVSTMERDGLAIIGKDRNGEPRVNHQIVKIVESMWPTFEVHGVIIRPQLSVGAQEFRDGPVYWDGPYAFAPGEQQEMDFLVEGIYISIRIQIATAEYWRFHAYGLEISTAGDML